MALEAARSKPQRRLTFSSISFSVTNRCLLQEAAVPPFPLAFSSWAAVQIELVREERRGFAWVSQAGPSLLA